MEKMFGFIILCVLLLALGIGLAFVGADKAVEMDRAKAERAYAQAEIIRAHAETSVARAQASNMIIAGTMPFVAIAVIGLAASIPLSLIVWLLLVVAKRILLDTSVQQVQRLPSPTIVYLPEGTSKPAYLPEGASWQLPEPNYAPLIEGKAPFQLED